MATKSFKQMNKKELVDATEKFGLTAKVLEIAEDKEDIKNAEYVTVLEEFKAAQAEVNGVEPEDKPDVSSDEDPGFTTTAEPEAPKGKKLTKLERAALKQVKFKYIVSDHQSSVQIEDDDETRTFPIQYGNLTTGPKNWNVGLHGNPQSLPFSVVKKLEELKMVVHIKNAKGEPTAKTQSRFRVTKVDGFTQDQIDELKRTQNTRKFSN